MITKEQHEEIVTDYNKFNAFMVAYTESIIQRVFLEIPDLILIHIKTIQDTKKARDKFYSNYPELKDKQEHLGKVINKLRIENASWNMDKLYNEAGKVTKQLLSEEAKINGQGI